MTFAGTWKFNLSQMEDIDAEKRRCSMNVIYHRAIVEMYLFFKCFHKALGDWKLEMRRLQKWSIHGKLLNEHPLKPWWTAVSSIFSPHSLWLWRLWRGARAVPHIGKRPSAEPGPMGNIQRRTALLTAHDRASPWQFSTQAQACTPLCNNTQVSTCHRKLH